MRYRSKLVDCGSPASDSRALTTRDFPSGAQARSERSPKGLDGTSAMRSAPTRVAVVAGAAPSIEATKMRLRLPLDQVSQWRMNMRSNTTPLALGEASSRVRLQAMSPLQSANALAAKAMRLPSGDRE